MSDRHASSSVVQVPAASDRLRTARPGLRLVGVPDMRHEDGRDPVRPPTAGEVQLVGPHPHGGELRLLCCEGACSPLLAVYNQREAMRQAVGYSHASNRAHESAALVHTPHYFVRTFSLAATVYQLWACATCGHERTYGAEEV